MPAHVQKHIDLIKPTVQFNHRAGAKSRAQKSQAPTQYRQRSCRRQHRCVGTYESGELRQPNNLACLRALYGIDYTPVATDKNTFGIGMFVLNYTSFQSNCTLSTVEFTPQAFLPGDLDLFFR